MDSPVTLHAWLAQNARPVGPGDRHFVEQAARLFECIGVHLLERRKRGIDPVDRLRWLRSAMPGDRTALLRDLFAIFADFGDRHSRCVPPPPWSERFAYLPLVVGACVEEGRRTLLVTGSASPDIRPGDRLVSWDGYAVDEALQTHGRWQLGANPAARLAKAVQTLTVRPLALLPPPDAAVEVLTEGPTGRRIARLDWRVAGSARVGKDLAACAAPQLALETTPEGLGFCRLPSPAGPIGWVRIPSLRLPWHEFLPALATLLDRAPPLGLVLDLRGCEEGFVQTGERMLRLFTDRTVEPIAFEFRLTAWLRDLVRSNAALAEWREAVEAGCAAHQTYSAARPLTPSDALDATARCYGGRLIVLVDALTYSSAEMFAAGVQDHGIGLVLGVAPCTGGGGGSAWSQDLVHRLSGDDFFAPASGLPSLRMAVLRCRRNGANASRPLEGDGVMPDVVHATTRRDLLCADADLVACATKLIGEMQ